MLDFQRADVSRTLDEGLAEYYASGSDLAGGRGASAEAREFFRCHDAARIVFGCSTTLLDEAMVKSWSFFGTTRGLRLFREYGRRRSTGSWSGARSCGRRFAPWWSYRA